MTDPFATTTRDLGGVRIDAITDSVMRQPFASVYAARPAPTSPEALAERYPEEFDAAGWHFIVRTYLVRSEHVTVLVDAGTGPAATPQARFVGMPGRLLIGLAALGVAPDDVDHVVVTHAHDDHIGWLGDADGPTFPSATYWLHGEDLALAAARTDEDAAYTFPVVLGPLIASGQVEHAAAPHELARGLEIEPLPGHTPGHQGLRVDGADATALLVGDLLHFGYQLDDPSIPSPFDRWPEDAAAQRTATLDRVRAEGLLLGTAHLQHPFLRLSRV